MDRRGSVTLLGLWTAAASVAVALSVLAVARGRAERAAGAFTAVGVRIAAAQAALDARADDLSQASSETTRDGFSVRVRRTFGDDRRTAIVVCDVEAGRRRATCRVAWSRAGADWRPILWSER